MGNIDTLPGGLVIGRLLHRGLSIRFGYRPSTDGMPPLLIFNGIGASMELLAPFIEAIPDTGVITFDVPGAGDSQAPLLPWRLSSHARLATTIMRRLDVSTVNVLGVSWGGALAQQFARQYPERTGRLILAATSPGQIMVPAKPAVLLKMAHIRRYRDPGYMRSIAGDIYGGSLRKDHAALGRHTANLRRPNERGYYYQILAGLGWSSLCWLHKLKQPTLILQGEDDPIIPRLNGKVLARLIPDARLITVDCGHLFLLTRAWELAPVITEFLAGGPTDRLSAQRHAIDGATV